MKNFFFIITTVILVKVITFINSEIILRIYVQITPTMFSARYKKYNQFLITPNAWINGFQDKEFTVQKEKNPKK